jgi:hypothetical protein
VTDDEPEEMKPEMRDAREEKIEFPDTDKVEDADRGPATFRYDAIEVEADEINPVKKERAWERMPPLVVMLVA